MAALMSRRLLACLALGLVLGAGDSFAQVKPVSTAQGMGFIGIPEFTSTETGIPFFFKVDADLADGATIKMREAAAKCDRNAYEAALNSLNSQISNYQNDRPAVITPDVQRTLEQSQRDAAALGDVVKNRPPYPANCAPPGGYAPLRPLTIFLTGGAAFPLSGTGATTGVDTFFGPGAYQIDNRPAGNGSAVAPVGGVRLRFEKQWNDFVENQIRNTPMPSINVGGDRPNQVIFPGTTIFIEGGIQTGFGSNSFMQSFQGVSGVPQAFGQQAVRENFEIPILIGVSTPIFTLPGGTPFYFSASGGVTLSSWTHTLSGGELGGANTPRFSGQQDRFTVDPTVAFGFSVPVPEFFGPGSPTAILGINAEALLRPGGVVMVPSTGFGSETYYGTIDPRVIINTMFRIGFRW